MGGCAKGRGCGCRLNFPLLNIPRSVLLSDSVATCTCQGMCLWALNNGSREWKSQSASEVPGLAVIGLVSLKSSVPTTRKAHNESHFQAVWGAGFAIEVVADYQKTAWNSKIPSGAQKTWIATGLWRWESESAYCIWAQHSSCGVGQVFAAPKFLWRDAALGGSGTRLRRGSEPERVSRHCASVPPLLRI